MEYCVYIMERIHRASSNDSMTIKLNISNPFQKNNAQSFCIPVKVKKVKFALEKAIKAHRGIRSITPLFL